MTQYKEIAELYEGAVGIQPIKKFSVVPSLFKTTGEVAGLDVLDLACGTGIVCRELKKRGAKNVVGVDLEEEMLNKARQAEAKNPLGICYHNFNVATMPLLGMFDLVTANCLLHYAGSKEELTQMGKSIIAHLKPGCRLVTVNASPCNPLRNDPRYNVIVSCQTSLHDGAKLTVTYLDNSGQPLCSFDNFHWSKQTYEEALTNSGFSSVNWHALTVTDEGIKEFGREFWQPHLNNQTLVVIECQTPE